MTLLVRAAELRDAARLGALCEDIQRLHVAARPDQFQPTQADGVAAWFSERLASPNGQTWVAQDGDNVVGYVVTRVRVTEAGLLVRARTWWDVDEIGVDAAHRRGGVARVLLETVVVAARAAGISTIELNCWAFNRDAQRAFTSLGFVPKSTRFELPLEK